MFQFNTMKRSIGGFKSRLDILVTDESDQENEAISSAPISLQPQKISTLWQHLRKGTVCMPMSEEYAEKVSDAPDGTDDKHG
ncbi:MAG: hypothetical protein ACLU48_02050 [Clostridiaceae bacterium]